MKLRIKFKKHGSMRFIGHLDLMRYFQKTLRRIGLPVEYSKGFNPHQIMSFTSPLGVGMTSSAEYLDVRIMQENTDLIMLKNDINEALNGEIFVTDINRISEAAKTSMAALSAADYYIFSKQKYPKMENFYHSFEHFMTQKDITIAKEGRAGTSFTNIAPFIYETDILYPGTKEYDDAFTTYEDDYPGKDENLPVVYLMVSSGSVFHVKPQQPLKAFYESMGQDFEDIFFHYHRIDMYADLNETPKETPVQRAKRRKKLISMNEYGVEK